MEGPVYEPRAFWEVARVIPTRVGRPESRTLDRENFRNGTRWPVELTHMLVGSCGYVYSSFPGVNTPPQAVGDIDACTAMLERVKVQVGTPERFRWSWSPLGVGSAFVPEQARDMSLRTSPFEAWSAGLLNVCRWDFPEHRPMMIPRWTRLEFGLGALAGQLLPGAGVRPHASVGFFEDYGMPGGSARTVERRIEWTANMAGYPCPPADGLGALQGTTPQHFPPSSRFEPVEFRRQESTRAGSTRVAGFAVALDQLAWEAALQDSAPPFAGSPVASVALRLPTMARSVDQGSMAEWWRPGCPLALVSPTMTPAISLRLPHPIMLNPGDALEVDVEVPGGVLGEPSDPPIFPIYQVGISFTGFARVEG